MPKETISISFSVNIHQDKDIIEILEAHKDNKSEFIRQAIRYYAGLLSQKSSEEEINQALLRVIQLEKKFNDFVAKQEERYQRLLELVHALNNISDDNLSV